MRVSRESACWLAVQGLLADLAIWGIRNRHGVLYVVDADLHISDFPIFGAPSIVVRGWPRVLKRPVIREGVSTSWGGTNFVQVFFCTVHI